MASYRAFTLALSTAARPALTALPGKTTATAAIASYSLRNRRYALQNRLFHVRPALLEPQPTQSATPDSSNPVVSSMAQSESPTGHDEARSVDRAAFLGEADSNDAHETWRDVDAKPHEAMDSTNAAYLGEADSNDGFESQQDIEGRRAVPLDARNAAYLGEADSDDGFEADFVEHPEDHRHQIDPQDARNAAFLGEADSNDGHEADREEHPEKYRHKIEDVSPSGIHGESGNQDQ